MKPLCVISCPIDTFSGYGARSRDFVRALFKLKKEEWDIHIFPQKWGECPWGYLDENDPLKKFMTSNPLFISVNSPASKALSLMNDRKITSLLVASEKEYNKAKKNKKLKGIVHIHSLLQYGIK